MGDQPREKIRRCEIHQKLHRGSNTLLDGQNGLRWRRKSEHRREFKEMNFSFAHRSSYMRRGAMRVRGRISSRSNSAPAVGRRRIGPGEAEPQLAVGVAFGQRQGRSVRRRRMTMRRARGEDLGAGKVGSLCGRGRRLRADSARRQTVRTVSDGRRPGDSGNH